MRITCSISGIKYYNFIAPSNGDRLILMPEPNNRHDKFAVAVYNTLSQQIGYLPKRSKINLQALTMLNRYVVEVRVIGILQKSFYIEVKALDSGASKNPPPNNSRHKKSLN